MAETVKASRCAAAAPAGISTASGHATRPAARMDAWKSNPSAICRSTTGETGSGSVGRSTSSWARTGQYRARYPPWGGTAETSYRWPRTQSYAPAVTAKPIAPPDLVPRRHTAGQQWGRDADRCLHAENGGEDDQFRIGRSGRCLAWPRGTRCGPRPQRRGQALVGESHSPGGRGGSASHGRRRRPPNRDRLSLDSVRSWQHRHRRPHRATSGS